MYAHARVVEHTKSLLTAPDISTYGPLTAIPQAKSRAAYKPTDNPPNILNTNIYREHAVYRCSK